MVTSPYEWKILEWNEKAHNKNIWFPIIIVVSSKVISQFSIIIEWFGRMLTVDPLSRWIYGMDATSCTCCTDKTISSDDNVFRVKCGCIYFLLIYMFSQSGLIFHDSCKLLQMQGISLWSVGARFKSTYMANIGHPHIHMLLKLWEMCPSWVEVCL